MTNPNETLTAAVNDAAARWVTDWYEAEKHLNKEPLLKDYGLVAYPEWKADVAITYAGNLIATGTYRLETLLVTDWEGCPELDENEELTDDEAEALLDERVELLLEEAGLAWEGKEYAGYNSYNGVNNYRVTLATPVVVVADREMAAM